ncbi:MAG: DsbA family oxidoreductase [Phyllobacterium sp.]
MTEKQIEVDVVSDVVCPWCFIGRKRLLKAIGMLPHIEIVVNWRPFQLDPTIPAGGKDRTRYMKDKFGSEARIAEIHHQISQVGEEEGIEFDFEAITVAPNTLDAHRVVRWASQAGPGVQNRVVGELFSLYFEQGSDIGDARVLAETAQNCGMDGAIVAALLQTDAETAAVQQEIQTANAMGVSGVPCFIINQKYAVMGAQSADVIADALQQAAEGFEPG